MFLMVVMSYGSKDAVYGTGSTSDIVELTEIVELLAAKKFPLMCHKPKVVIVQSFACGKYCLFLREITNLNNSGHA